MADATELRSIVQKPEFMEMSEEAQIKVVERLNEDFAKISLNAKSITLRKLMESPAPQKQTPQKTFLQSAADLVPQVGGGIVGGILGTPGGLPGVVAGVALGAAAGEGYKQVGEHIVGAEGAPKTSGEAAIKIGKAAGEEVVGELVGRGVFKLGGKILAPFAKKVTPEATRVMNAFKDRLKPFLTPAEATNSRILDIMENMGESSLIGGGKFQEFKFKRQQVLDDISGELVEQFGKVASPEEFGELFVRAVENKKATVKPVVDMLYNRASELAGDVVVSTSKLKGFVEPMRETAITLKGIEGANAGDDLIDAVLNLPDNVSFEVAKELRTRLLSRVNEISVLNKKAPAIGKAKKLISLIDSEMEKTLTEKSPEAVRAWRTANNFYKETGDRFNNTLVRTMLKKADNLNMGPETIGKAFFKPGNITGVKQLKAILSPEEYQKAQGFFIQNLFDKSTDTSGNLIGQKLMNNFRGKPTSFGDPFLNEIFQPQQIKALDNFAEALKLSQAKQGGGTGSMFIQLAQPGAVIGLATGTLEPASTAILIGPAIMSRAMLNPKISKLLTEGLHASAGSEKLAGIMARLTAAMINITMTKEDK